ncbi:MAG: tetratricopeptide repeat protein, partial [Massilia sp.]
MRKHILAASLALLLCTAAHAGFTPNPAAKALMDEGWAAKAAQHYQEAADKFSAAAKADPQASAPLSALAALVFNLTPGDGPKAESGRKQVRFLVQRALALAPFDPVAQEILRLLDDVTPAPLHLATPAAAPLFAEAEALFEKRDYDAAVAKYEAAAAADPLLSRAWVYAGDCFFMREQYVEAERRYRKGAEIEPLNSQAWRFLSDALLKQGKGQAA